MGMMRAIIVSHAAIKASNRPVYRALAARDCEVTLIVPDRWKSGLGPLRAEPEPPGSTLDVRVRKRYGVAHSNMYWLGGSLADLVGTDRKSAFYVDEDPAGLMVAQAAQAARKRQAGLVLLGIQNIYKRYPPPFEFLQDYVFRTAAAAVSVTEEAAQTLHRRGYTGPNAIMPFTTGVAPLLQAQRDAVRERYGLRGQLAGCVGRLVPEKGVDVFIEALAQLPDLTGVVAGDGPEREALERLARERGVDGRLTFTGVLTPPDAEALIGALDVLALPSRTRPNWAEQFGRVIIEAMASAVPVVASNSGSIAVVAGEDAILVPEGDAAALAAGLAAALDSARAATLRTGGLKRVRERYTVDVAADALYKSLEFAASSAAGMHT
jgi:glycosyltransferase involved in cell wall biosynthesis